MNNFKYLVKDNMIRNCPVTLEDVSDMEKIWGTDISYLKGKMVRRSPRKVIKDDIAIPNALYKNCAKVTLHMDIFFINKIPFLAIIGHPMYYRMCAPLDSRNREDIFKTPDR